MVRRLAERGGITGINFCKEFLGKPDVSQNYLDQAVVHMKYLMNLGGEDLLRLVLTLMALHAITICPTAVLCQNWSTQ